MPTVLRTDGLRFVVYPNDHAPAHVHVFGAGWVLVANLRGPEVREVVGPCAEREARRVLDITAMHRAALLAARRRFHG